MHAPLILARYQTRGFTLIAALVGGIILAVGAIVVCGLSQRCIRDSVLGQRYEQGYRLLDECLERTVALGVATLARQENWSGTFPRRYPGYQFVVRITPTDQDHLYRVAARVTWRRDRQQYQVAATTLIYDLAPARPTDEKTTLRFTE